MTVNETPAGDDFKKVEEPKIGDIYHLSWAYRGAKFRLRFIEGNECWMQKPNHPHSPLLRSELDQLRHIR